MAAGSSSLTNFLTFLFPSQPPHQKTIKPTSQITSPLDPSFPTLTSSPSPSTRICIPPQNQDRFNGFLQNRMTKNGFLPVHPINHSTSCSVLSVVCPSLAYSNTLFFSGYHNVEVAPEDDENREYLIQRFRREVMKARILPEIRRRRWFENRREETKRKRKEAAIKNRKKRRFPWKYGPGDNQSKEGGEEKVDKDDDDDDEQDNWEMLGGGDPY